MFYVYVLCSEKDGSLYIGQTNNLDRRMSDHNKGFSKSTKSKVPYQLLFAKKMESRSEAMRFEKHLKSFKNKSYVLLYIKANQ